MEPNKQRASFIIHTRVIALAGQQSVYLLRLLRQRTHTHCLWLDVALVARERQRERNKCLNWETRARNWLLACVLKATTRLRVCSSDATTSCALVSGNLLANLLCSRASYSSTCCTCEPKALLISVFLQRCARAQVRCLIGAQLPALVPALFNGLSARTRAGNIAERLRCGGAAMATRKRPTGCTARAHCLGCIGRALSLKAARTTQLIRPSL